MELSSSSQCNCNCLKVFCMGDGRLAKRISHTTHEGNKISFDLATVDKQTLHCWRCFGAHLSLRIHRVQEQRQDGRRPALTIGRNDRQSKLTVTGMGFYWFLKLTVNLIMKIPINLGSHFNPNKKKTQQKQTSCGFHFGWFFNLQWNLVKHRCLCRAEGHRISTLSFRWRAADEPFPRLILDVWPVGEIFTYRCGTSFDSWSSYIFIILFLR